MGFGNRLRGGLQLISIIVPVYNAENTIDRCLGSVRRQTYRDIEVIIVDDGSTDKSCRLIRKYTEEDSRFRLIEKENTGVSDTRNVGIEHAHGEYLQFADSDDWLSENASQFLLDAMLLYNADMAISDYVRVYERSAVVMGNLPESGCITCPQYATHMMKAPADYYYGAMWNKLYRSEIVMNAGIRCSTEVCWGEDFLFNIEYLSRTRRIAVIHQPIYFYVKRKGSIIDMETNLSSIIKVKSHAYAPYKRFYDQLELYEDHKLRIRSYYIAIAHDKRKAIAKKEMPVFGDLGGEQRC